MPVLPSGRFAGIMSERARYHAARLKLRVTESTPHYQLYPVIDILIEQGGGAASPTYGFSGKTLADLQQLDDWSDEDRRFFRAWLRETAQVQTIELARRRLLVEKGVPREQVFPYPQRLYSLLQRRLEALPQQRASASQWQRTLLNMRRDGVRREELEWSGVLNYLGRKPGAMLIDKAVLLSALDFSAIEPRLSSELECDRSCQLPFAEVAERLPAYQLQLAGYRVGDRDVGVVRYSAGEPNYRVGVIWPEGHSLQAEDEPHWFLLGPYGQALPDPSDKQQLLFGSARQALDAANRHALRSHRLRCDLAPSARYEYMTLHGGTDYREWLVTLPHYQRSHFTGHFFERNILLHVRSKVRVSEAGQRVLFIEEIQSDWHQAMARKGLRSGIPVAPFRKEWSALALKLMLLHVVETGLDGIAWADGGVHEMRYDKVLTPLRRLYDQELEASLNRLARPWQLQVGRGRFATRLPWLHAERSKSSWRVEGGHGKFVTRARFEQHEALQVIERHSKAVTLELPMLLLSEAMRQHIAAHGLPLFGLLVE